MRGRGKRVTGALAAEVSPIKVMTLAGAPLRRPSAGRVGRWSPAGTGVGRLSLGTVVRWLSAGGVIGWLAARRLGRVTVAGASMRPTLEPGDRLLVHRTRRLRAGDLAVLTDPRVPERSVVKRVTVIGDGQVSVLGDNPAESTDSRHYGPVALIAVEGRPWYRYVPPERAGRLHRHSPR